MKNEIEDLIKEIEESLLACVRGKFLNAPNNAFTRDGIKYTVLKQLRQNFKDEFVINEIAVDVAPDESNRNKVNIKPSNLFTGLLMFGIAPNEARKYIGHAGCKLNNIEFQFKDNNFQVQVPEPIEFIEIKFDTK